MRSGNCAICNQHFNALGSHIVQAHNSSLTDYYEWLVAKDGNEHNNCKECGGVTKIISLSRGYNIFCGYSCKVSWLNKQEQFKNNHISKLKRLWDERKLGPRVSYYRSKNSGVVPCRSLYELRLCELLDKDPTVSHYTFEPFWIPYRIFGEWRRYLPDFLVERKDGTGDLIEVKPSFQLNDDINEAKFKFAEKYCDSINLNWIVITEKELWAKY